MMKRNEIVIVNLRAREGKRVVGGVEVDWTIETILI
jgi:hypothetical protein